MGCDCGCAWLLGYLLLFTTALPSAAASRTFRSRSSRFVRASALRVPHRPAAWLLGRLCAVAVAAWM